MAIQVISQRALRDFWQLHPDAETPLRRWYQTVTAANWSNFGDLRRTFATADTYRQCVIFNVGGNKYRVIAAAHFNRRKLSIREVLSSTFAVSRGE